MADRLELARLWQVILQSNPDQLFGSDAEILIQSLDTGDDLPQPGFVGSSYRPGGVLFLGNNPGNSPSDPHKLGNLEKGHVLALRDLKGAPLDSLQGSFEALMESLVPIMAAWCLVQNYVHPIISGADIDLDSIAYLNLFKWRSSIFEWHSSKGTPAHAYRESWREHTRKQFLLLRPKFVIALGTTTFNAFEKVSNSRDIANVKKFALERRRNDCQTPPDKTLRLMPDIASEIRHHFSN